MWERHSAAHKSGRRGVVSGAGGAHCPRAGYRQPRASTLTIAPSARHSAVRASYAPDGQGCARSCPAHQGRDGGGGCAGAARSRSSAAAAGREATGTEAAASRMSAVACCKLRTVEGRVGDRTAIGSLSNAPSPRAGPQDRGGHSAGIAAAESAQDHSDLHPGLAPVWRGTAWGHHGHQRPCKTNRRSAHGVRLTLRHGTAAGLIRRKDMLIGGTGGSRLPQCAVSNAVGCRIGQHQLPFHSGAGSVRACSRRRSPEQGGWGGGPG